MKIFINKKFQSVLFDTYCKTVDNLTAENFFLTKNFSFKEYENSKLKAMILAQKNEDEILKRRKNFSDISKGKILFSVF